MMHRAPVPAFPAVGVVMDLRVADRVAETEQRRKVVAATAHRMVRSMRYRHRARAVGPLQSLDLGGNEVERLIPRNTHIAGLAAVLRLALAGGIEVDPFHGIEKPIG